MAKLLSIQETAKQLSVSADTVRRLIRANQLGSVRIARRVMLPEDEVARVIHQGCGRYARGQA